MSRSHTCVAIAVSCTLCSRRIVDPRQGNPKRIGDAFPREPLVSGEFASTVHFLSRMKHLPTPFFQTRDARRFPFSRSCHNLPSHIMTGKNPMQRVLIALMFVLMLITAAGAQSTVDTVLAMSDGIKLELLYCTPPSPPPSNGYPGIVIVHGFQGSKENVRANAVDYAKLGYVTLGYSVRGQGGSEGEFDFFTSERVLADLKEMIDFTKALPNVNRDRIGVLGGSQGGIHAWAAAAHHLGARAVASIIANGRFEENWVANDAMNWTFARTIAVTTTRLKPGMKDSINLATTSGNISWVKELLGRYSTRDLESAVTTPTLIAVSYFDGFFNPSSALRQFARIPAPKRIFLYPGAHNLPGDGPTSNHVLTAIARWFNYWLKDDQSDSRILSEDSSVVMFDAATNEAQVFALRDSACWLNAPSSLPARLSARTWYLASGGLSNTEPAPGQKSFSYANILGSTPVTFRTTPFDNDLQIAGTFGRATLASDGSATMYQLNLLLFDIDPATGKTLPVTRGHYEYKQNTSGPQDVASFELNTVAHTVKAGHLLEARIHGGIGLVPNASNDFGNVVLGPVQNSTNTIYFGGNQPSSFTLYFLDKTSTGIEETASRPVATALSMFPNPVGPGSFSGSDRATVQFMNQSQNVHLALYNVLGREMATLVSGDCRPGSHQLAFDAASFPAGQYHLVLRDGQRLSRRLIVVMK
jgi:predicted acyl esterase